LNSAQLLCCVTVRITPPCSAGEGISSDISNSCARINVGQILGTLCRRKAIEIIEAEDMSDHVHMHMLLRISRKYSVSEILGYLKGKSSLMIFEKHANLKYKYGNGTFGAAVTTSTYADIGLSRHGREEYSGNKGVYSKSGKRGFGVRPDVVSRVYRPVYG